MPRAREGLDVPGCAAWLATGLAVWLWIVVWALVALRSCGIFGRPC